MALAAHSPPLNGSPTMAKKKKKKEYDLDEAIGQIRELLAEEADQQSWRKLLNQVAAVPADAADAKVMLIDYIEGNIDHWPEATRRPYLADWQAHKKGEELEIHRLIGNFEEHPMVSLADVDAVAPDRKSVTTAKSTAKPGKWQQLGREGQHYWGYASGSQDDYYVWVSLISNEFLCSCPSRKRPCKHALALLLLEEQGHEVPLAETPDSHKYYAEQEYYNSWE